MRARLVLLLPVLLAGLVAPGAAAAASPSRLKVAALRVSAGEVRPGQLVVVRGRIANRGPRSRAALVSLSLRPGARSRAVESLPGVRLARVRGRGTRAFTVRAPISARLFDASATRRLAVVACVRPRRGARAVCRTARRRLVLRPAGPGAPPSGGGTPPPGSASPQAPAPSASPAPGFRPGTRSAGDVLFPAIGNGGYDARHYDLAVDYTPATRVLQGRTTLTAVATQDLSELSLDLQGLGVSAVTVGGAAAAFRRDGTKLIVTPARGLPAGSTFAVGVVYGGVVSAVKDPDGSEEGWVPTADGAFVVGEPIGAQGWFSNNNTPADKATYDVAVTVPAGLEVMGNGDLVSHDPAPGGRTTWHWREGAPMASYLVTASVGEFDVTTDTTNPARPLYVAMDSGYSAVQKAAIARDQGRVPAILDYFASLYGSYPFSTAGGIVDRASVGYSLETQSKPSYPGTVTVATVAHENGHQWFGDSVSPRVWSDIWLNEGLTEFSSWLWQERQDAGEPTSVRFTRNYESPAMTWSVPPAAPATAADMFDTDAMYTRGAMVCEALRQILGEPTFLQIMRAWATEHRHGNGTTAEYIALVKRLGKRDPARLDAFFDQWLYRGERPSITPASF